MNLINCDFRFSLRLPFPSILSFVRMAKLSEIDEEMSDVSSQESGGLVRSSSSSSLNSVESDGSDSSTHTVIEKSKLGDRRVVKERSQEILFSESELDLPDNYMIEVGVSQAQHACEALINIYIISLILLKNGLVFC